MCVPILPGRACSSKSLDDRHVAARHLLYQAGEFQEWIILDPQCVEPRRGPA